MTRGPVVIESESVSTAWASAFNEIADAPRHEIVPLIVCVTGFDENVVREDQRVRALLDAELRGHGMPSIRTVASTIFPSSLWNPNNPPQALFDRYLRVLPRLHKCRLNHNGLYFERMIQFHPKGATAPVNQLAHILATREAGNHRRSAYQAVHHRPHAGSYESASARLIDLHGNGDRGVLLAVDSLDPTRPDQVLYFGSEGKLEWTLEPKPQLLKSGGAAFEDAWKVRHLTTVAMPKGYAVYLAMFNAAGWGGCILRVDDLGGPTVQFANAGYVEDLCPVWAPDDPLMVVCGENNDFDSAFVALLGINDPPSCSIPGNRTVYRFANPPGEVPRKYILFPQTELIAARKKPYGHAERIRQYPGRVIIEVETGGDGGRFLYHFTDVLEPLYVFPSGSHENVHRSFESTGTVDHPWLQCPELRRPLLLKAWTRVSGWHTQEIAWRDNPWKDDPESY